MQDNATTSQLPRIGLSQGDFNGISYEIMLKAFSDARMFETFTPVLYGQSKAFSYYKKNFGMESPNYSLTRDARQSWDKKFNIINIVENELKIEPGAPSGVSAEMSVLSMKRAADDLQKGYIDALVMAPDSPAVAKSNRDFLLSFHKEADPVQVLVNGQLRIGLATGDVPLSTALEQIDIRFLTSKLSTFAEALKTDFGISSPKIAVMGVNPHSGSLPTGDDEKVVKAVGDAQRKGIFAFGPFSVSQLFVTGWWKKYDGIMALHYEQGVFPMKFLSLDGCAYYWAGPPVVCAAPLHGPAFDIANTNQAVPDAYRKAIFLAYDVLSHRKEQ
ncbi:MAG: 4-hydroxythreonine-4-phosphate dehydrogenase PdxA [Bacteroidales bacterium]|jgi:4-hydroxythreonine-4-phosphate dehydrogenase|nr:4-hydroxythreonine-4-phosphate dehydrogenase PdxA [Bacteroidales bacterium]